MDSALMEIVVFLPSLLDESSLVLYIQRAVNVFKNGESLIFRDL
jgi:hypothetical protein